MKKTIVVAIVLLLAVVAFSVWYFVGSNNSSKEKFYTYDDCVAATHLPCAFYYVGDLGHEWKPSPYHTQEACEAAGIQVGFECVIPPGDFIDVRWISSADLKKANSEGAEEGQNGTQGDNEKVSVGIMITSPQPGEAVIFPVTVEGFVLAGDWFVFEGEAGTVQAFDANDKAVSNKVILSVEDGWLEKALAEEPIHFEVAVGDREMVNHLDTDTGYLLFQSTGAKNGDVVSTYKVPIEFKKSAL